MSLVVPALNEARNIGWVLERVPPLVDEVILVDGGSTDDTVAVSRSIRPDIRVIGQDRPGKGAALRAGFASAYGDVIVMIDADRSMDPHEIERFVALIDDGYDLVKGSRFMPGGGTDDMERIRRLGNGALNALVNVLFRADFTDLCYGYAAMRRGRLEDLALTSDGFEIEAEIVVRALRAGLRIAEVPSFEAPRAFGESNLDTWRDGRRVLKTLLRHRIRDVHAARSWRGAARPRHRRGTAHDDERVDRRSAAAARCGEALTASTSQLTVVVPVRNGEHWIAACLESIARSSPAEVIVVDGRSSDRTVELAAQHGVRVLCDGGRGVAAARHMGAELARTRYVALIDVDALLGEGDLEALLEEFVRGGYAGLQAGLHSVAGPGYWGRALADHHHTGRSKHWFGLVATIFERDVLLKHGLDERFLSGEDIDLRWRLEQAGARIGVSRTTVVEHRFDDTWQFAKGQWLADGHGLGRMLDVHGLRSMRLLALPLAAAARGCALSLARRQPCWIPYYLCFCAFNYAGMVREVRRGAGAGRQIAVAETPA